ncbi:MAG: DUF3387 domain-containing protein [Treponema sp.]|nr:DUF3387 domain-containing protein [Treponema sp.]
MAKTKDNKAEPRTESPLEKQLWKSADKLRKNIDAAEYKHVVLGLIFLKYISDAFEDLHAKLKNGKGEYAGADPEDKDEYKAENVFFVPETARWTYLMEVLENSIKKYHNKIITATEVIEELIELSKEIHKMDKEPCEMGLTDAEYAFYTAIADNDSAKQLMKQDKLRELAVVLYKKVKENASIDWTIKESVKAKLKVIVKRILRQYGYPPDMQMLATETVLKQAELIAEELTGEK